VYSGGEVDIDFSTHALFRTRNENEKTRKLYYILEVEGVGSSEVKGYEVEMRYFKEVKIEGVPILKQGDYGGAIASVGCGLVSASMVLQYYQFNTATPQNIYDMQKSCWMDWKGLPTKLGISEQVSLTTDIAYGSSDLYEKIKGFLDNQIPVIAGADRYRLANDNSYGSGPHWVVIVGYNNDSFISINPTWGIEEIVNYDDLGRLFQHIKVYEKK
jgi:hypothetical protein